MNKDIYMDGKTDDAGKNTIKLSVPCGAGSTQVKFNEKTGVPYVNESGVVMVPLCATGEALGLKTVWDAENQCAKLTDLNMIPVIKVTITVEPAEYVIHRESGSDVRAMESIPVWKADHFFVPASCLAEICSYTLDWDAGESTLSFLTGWDAKTRARMELLFSALEDAKYTVNRPLAYGSGFDEYFDAFDMNYWMTLTTRTALTDSTMFGVHRLLEARKNLIQVADDPDETVWYIWGDNNIPAEEDAVNYAYTYSYDRSDFKPFLVPYLLENQSDVKGNIIIIAGGLFSFRSNAFEGYTIAKLFKKMGYNTFVLQRRVKPSTPTDAFMDLQRSIRYIRYHAEKYGIAKTDQIACCGFSGGAFTVCGALNNFYGDILPTSVYPDYRCDEIDKVNSDMQSAILIYGACALNTKNPRLPDVFIVTGSSDSLVVPASQLQAVEFFLSKGVRCEAHFFAGMEHGFGGKWYFNAEALAPYESPVTSVWPEMADTFLSVQWGSLEPVRKCGEQFQR